MDYPVLFFLHLPKCLFTRTLAYGGVAVSGLEMSQNKMFINWNRSEINSKLQDIMKNIHSKCVEYGTEDNFTNYVKGANIAGFIKVADAMLDQGVV